MDARRLHNAAWNNCDFGLRRHDSIGISLTESEDTPDLTLLVLAAGCWLFEPQKSSLSATINILAMLLSHGADVSLKEAGADRTCMHMAAANCDQNFVRQIIAAGTGINAPDDP